MSIEERIQKEVNKLKLTGIKLEIADRTTAIITGVQSGIKTIVIPDGIETITADFFNEDNQCGNVEKVVLPDSIKKINDYTFSCYDSLKGVNIPENLKWISEGAFRDCRSNIRLSGSLYNVEIIDSKAFEISGLTGKIEFGTRLRKLLPRAFKGTRIQEADLSETHIVKLFESVFEQCEKLEKVKLNNEILKICDNCFNGCSNLREINMPDNLETIGANVFKGCDKLEVVDLSKSNIERISPIAFSNNGNLKLILPERMREDAKHLKLSKDKIEYR